MYETLFSTDFIGEFQDMSFDVIGNQYCIGISIGGCVLHPEYDGKFDCAHSRKFQTYDEAFAAYVKLLKAFGSGSFDWETRKRMVHEA